MAQSPEYKAWINLRLRCNNPESRDYPNYGGRGIKVCDAWQDDFDRFLDDMGDRPIGRPGEWRLDRIDKDGDYEPSNCRWGVRAQTVAGVKRQRIPKGSKHPHARLNETSVRMLRESQLSTGEKRGVAARLGVTVKALDDAIRGRTWKHV